MAPFQQLGEESWSVVGAACCHMAVVFAVMHLYNFFIFIASVHSLLYCLKKTGLIIQWNGPRYQHVLALGAFLKGAIPKGIML